MVTWCRPMPASAQNLRFEEKQFFSSLFQLREIIIRPRPPYIYLNIKLNQKKGAINWSCG